MYTDTYIIHGGRPLRGEVELSGAKNASIKLMIASVLFDSSVTLHRVPTNEDNQRLQELYEDLGIGFHFTKNTVTLMPTQIQKHEVSLLHGSRIRSSFLLFGPLLHKFGHASIPNPGGCRIGARPIERIIDGIRALGVEVDYETETGFYRARKVGSIHGEYTFTKSTHTGTETLLLLAVVGDGETILHNCALEPEIDDLILFLNHGGAQVRRQGTDIVIHPVKKLIQKDPHTVLVDRNEAVTFASMAYATCGDITVTNVNTDHIRAFLDQLEKAQGGIQNLGNGRMRFYHDTRLKATRIQTAPHPGYMTDWQPQWGLMMATAEGVSEIHETLLEGRLNYVPELQKVGAHMELFQPEIAEPEKVYQFNYDSAKSYLQAVRITGVPRLHNGAMNIHDIRAGAVVVMAGLSAEGESIITGASLVERGYERLTEKIIALGGTIEKV